MKHLIPVLLVISLHTVAFSQSNGGAPAINSAQSSNYNLMGQIDFSQARGLYKSKFVEYEESLKEYKKIKGSPFFLGRELTVDIYDKEGRYAADVLIKYDLFNNEILARKDDSEQILLDIAHYHKIVGKGLDEGLTLKKLDTKQPEKFHVVLYQRDEISFFKEIKKEIYNHESKMPGIEKKKSFSTSEKYYLADGKKIYPIKLRSKRPFENIPRFKRSKLKTDLKKYGIKKLKSEESYIKYFRAKLENEDNSKKV